MNRRNFLTTTALSGLGLTISSFSTNTPRRVKRKRIRGTFSTDSTKTSIYTNGAVIPTRIFHITDTHLIIDDERGVPFQKFSKRMADAYQSNIHFQTGKELTAKESFEMTLKLAKEQKADFLALTGDIFSFPSEAAVEWAYQKLKDTGIPFAYIAGNHDWHYEGMEGSLEQLRETWVNKRLKPLFQGNNTLFAEYNLNGIRFVCIDNSTNEILPEQLEFFKTQVKSDIPLILLMHIPFYMPGRSLVYGCANPESGHAKVTMEFYDEVFNAANLLAIFTGHTHYQSLDIKNGIPQIVTGANATAAFTDIRVNEMP